MQNSSKVGQWHMTPMRGSFSSTVLPVVVQPMTLAKQQAAHCHECPPMISAGIIVVYNSLNG